MLIESKLPLLQSGNIYKITSPFGMRDDPVTGAAGEEHKGVDLVLWKEYGMADWITAPWAGTVTDVRDGVEGYDAQRSAGNRVTIVHGGGLVTKYYHMRRGTVKVQIGDRVEAGQVLGYIGSTGKSTGAHLHFQAEMDGVPFDPLPYITGDLAMDSVPATWAADAVDWAKKKGVLVGFGDGNLRLREPCTREMMLVFLHRALK
jgi:murein DD-endopeptidase MepM/ murein hydrolase activator NlpD